MAHETVSVIVPIYRVEHYVEACIRSLLAQTYDALELIVVNDGTPDRSAEIAEQILRGAGCIPYRIITQSNAGVSAARNAGIAAATGEWIVMVDADDHVTTNFIETLVCAADGDKSRAVFCDYRVIRENGTLTPPADGGVEQLGRHEAQREFLTRRLRLLLPTMLVSRDLLEKEDICFDPQCRYGEDVHFIWAVLCRAERVAFCHSICYNYILHSQSTMTASGIDKVVTGYHGLVRLLEKYIMTGDTVPELRTEIVPRGLFGSLHSAAKIMSFSDFTVLMARLDFPKWEKPMLRCRDRRISLIVTALRVCRPAGYLILRKF